MVIINAIIPLRFTYAWSHKKDISQELIDLATLISAEQNAVVDKFQSFGLEVKTVFESQTLLELKKNYCDYKKCLDCAVGHFILKK